LFLQLLGEDPALAAHFPEKRVNRSLTGHELSVLRQVNRVFKDETLSRKISADMLASNPSSPSAGFPASGVEPFRRFAEGYARELHAFDGPVMSQVRPLLFAESPLPADADHADDPEAMSALFGIALRHVQQLQQDYASEMKAFNSLRQLARKSLVATDEFFDPVHYLLMHDDVARSGKDPWAHFNNNGRREKRMTAFVKRVKP
jgi:hypothetical protein